MTETFDCFAILELFGHQIIAGHVSEQTISGQGFIRVDVPEVDGLPGFTKYYGPSAIYAITPTDEATVLHATRSLRPKPINTYQLTPTIASHINDDYDYE